MTPEVRAWLHDLRKGDRASAIQVGQAIGLLIEAGPELGRPLADRVRHSRLSNLKELRPGSAGRSEIRILYVFDPRRNAVLLVAGDKAGKWKAWYREAIPLAEQRYEDYLTRGHPMSSSEFHHYTRDEFLAEFYPDPADKAA